MNMANDRMVTWPRFVLGCEADIMTAHLSEQEPCVERPGPWTAWTVTVLDPDNVWGGMATARRDSEYGPEVEA